MYFKKLFHLQAWINQRKMQIWFVMLFLIMLNKTIQRSFSLILTLHANL